MSTEHIMREHEKLFENQNGFMNQTPLASEDQHGFNTQTLLTIKPSEHQYEPCQGNTTSNTQILLTSKPNEQQHEPCQENTTSNSQEHTETHHIPTRKPEDQHKKSKLERILETYDSYENVRQKNTERAIDFIRRFENAHFNLKQEGTPLPPHLLALDLLRKSNLSERDVRTAIASCDTERTGGPYLRALTLLRESSLEEDPEEKDTSPTTAHGSTDEDGQEIYRGIRSYLRLMDALRTN